MTEPHEVSNEQIKVRHKKHPGATIMLQGTASDVGKSLLAAALCRVLVKNGLKVAPFKSQNMSLNTYKFEDGTEIGIAQAMQAEACRIKATTDMNPILLKPTQDLSAQVIVHGKPYQYMSAKMYREQYLSDVKAVVQSSLRRLREQYEIVVIEGAGSPAEINLKDRDIVNMRLAAWADAPVLLVADIDRGGAFASIVGTLELLEPHERERVQGIIINKFRGDISLLQPGIDWLETRIQIPVLGVVPHLPNLALEDEDSTSLERKMNAMNTAINYTNGSKLYDKQLELAVIRLPRMANFAQLDPLLHENDVHVRWVFDVRDLHLVHPDLIIIPASQNEEHDLSYLHDSGLALSLQQFAGQRGQLVGIGNGRQLVQSVLRHIEDRELGPNVQANEISFDLRDDERRHAWLNRLRIRKGLPLPKQPLSYHALREQSFERLASHFEQHVDMKQIYRIIQQYHHS